MCSMKILASSGEIQDRMGAPKICRYKVLLKESNGMETQLNAVYDVTAVKFVRSCSNLSDMSKLEIIGKV